MMSFHDHTELHWRRRRLVRLLALAVLLLMAWFVLTRGGAATRVLGCTWERMADAEATPSPDCVERG